MFKNKGGFTLVELVVTIAILAILVGITVPTYEGYLKKSRDAGVEVELNGILVAAKAIAAEERDTVTKITVDASSVTVEVQSGEDFNTLTPYYDSTWNLEGTSYASGAVWTAGAGWQPK